MSFSKQKLLKLCFILFLIAVLFALATLTNYLDTKWLNQASTYEVTYIFDGDTIEVMMDGKKEKVRFIGVDTPETGGHDTNIECYGPEATTFTRSILTGQRVKLKADPLSTNLDRYGRLLRYVYRAEDNFDVNLELIKQGYSPKYNYFPFERSSEFKDAAEFAKTQSVGLWMACQK